MAYPELAPLTWFGWVGVPIFFVLSGFVIAYSAEGASPYSFIRSRILRLYPAVWICAPISAAALIAFNVWPAAEIINRLSRSISLSPVGPWIDGVYWTLGVEVAFYGLVWIMLCLRAFSRIDVLALLLTVLSAGFWLWRTLALANLLPPAPSSWIVQLFLAEHGCYFALGILLWLCLLKRITVFRLILSAVSFTTGIVALIPETLEKSQIPFSGYAVWVPAAVWAAAVFLVIVGTRSHALDGFATRLRLLGLATYPLYLLHQVVGAVAIRALVQTGVVQHVALVVVIVLMVALSLFVAAFVEPRVRFPLAALLDAIGGKESRVRAIANEPRGIDP